MSNGRLLLAVPCVFLVLAGCNSHQSGSSATNAPPPQVTVASVKLTGSTLVLAPGSSGTFQAQALDAAGNTLNVPISWTSSNTTIATVADGTVSAVSIGQAAITASAGSINSNTAQVVVNPSQTSSEAISAAVASGALSAEQGMVYRVFAIFQDPRLPVQYLTTSDQPPQIQDLELAEVANAFDSLTPQDQDLVGPYLVPPAYWGSSGSAASSGYPHHSHSASVHDISDRPGYCHFAIGSNWKSVASAHFRVFYDSPTDAASASTVAARAAAAAKISSYAETSYTTLLGSGFNKPISDGGVWGCDGGDALYDIYINDQNLGGNLLAVTVPLDAIGDGSTAPAFTTIGAGPALADGVSAIVAHELMHAIQFSYPNMGLPSYFWSLDATAVWAENYVFPAPDPGSLMYVPSFLKLIDRPLFYPNHYCGELPCDKNDDDLKVYGAYLFFEFISKNSGAGVVSSFFSNAASLDDSLPNLNYTLTGQGGLTQVWSKFVLALWNQAPVDNSFAAWDGATLWDEDTISSIDIGNADPPYTLLSPEKKQPDGTPVAVDLPELSAVYEQYEFLPKVHSVVFYNGFGTKLSLRDAVVGAYVTNGANQNLDGGNIFVSFAPTQDQIQGRHIWAIKKINDVWQQPEDWTTYPYQPICLDAANQRVQTLIIIYSNGNFTTARNGDFDDNAAQPLGDQRSALVASTTPCWKYQGSSKTTFTYDDGTDKFTIHAAATGTFVGQPTYAQGDVQGGNAVAFKGWVFQADPATLLYNADVSAMLNSCKAGYTYTAQMQGGAEHWPNPAQIYSWAGYQLGTQGYDAYSTGSDEAFQFVANDCANGKTKTLPSISVLSFNLDFTSFQKLTSDGLMTSGTLNPTGPVWDNGDYTNPGPATYSWCLAPLRENPEGPTPGCD